jgi:hypothetical protein
VAVENFSRQSALWSLPQICSERTKPAAIKPPAMAVAIRPHPMNPIFKSAAAGMLPLEFSC